MSMDKPVRMKDPPLWREVLSDSARHSQPSIKYVKVDIEEDGKTAHFKMPFGEMKQTLTTGPAGGPVCLENHSLPFLSDVKACHSFFWNFADHGRHFDYKDRCGTWADLAFAG